MERWQDFMLLNLAISIKIIGIYAALPVLLHQILGAALRITSTSGVPELYRYM